MIARKKRSGLTQKLCVNPLRQAQQIKIALPRNYLDAVTSGRELAHFLGISEHEFSCVIVLGEYGSQNNYEVSNQQIREQAGLSGPQLSKAMSCLEERGYAQRAHGDYKSKYDLFRLTKPGIQIYQKISEARQ